MNKPPFFIIGGLVLLCFFFVVIFFYFFFGTLAPGQQNTGLLPTNGTVPSASTPSGVSGFVGSSVSENTQASSNIVLPTAVSETLTARNFVQDADVAPVTPIARGAGIDSGIYYSLGSLPYEISASSSPMASSTIPTALERGYETLYFPDEKTFSVFIFKEPIGDMRREVGLDLANRLGISATQLCNVLAFIWISPLANERYAGKNVGFAHCPGATLLPGD